MDWHSLTDEPGAWSKLDYTERAAGTPRVDPYLAWADATAFADLGGTPDDWVRVIIELEAPVSAQSFAEKVERTKEWKSWIKVSSMYRYPPADLQPTRFLTAIVTQAFFENLDSKFKGIVKRFELGMPVVPDDLPAPGKDAVAPEGLACGEKPAFKPLTAARPSAANDGSDNDKGKMTFLGVMDDGIAFAHERFRHVDAPLQSRIECFWNQDDAPDKPVAARYGRELRKADIDALLTRCTQAGQVDEDAVYGQVGYIDVRKRRAHGTEVMDLAAGVRHGNLHADFVERERFERHDALLETRHDEADIALLDNEGDERAALEKVRLIAVQFRTAGRTVRDTSGRWFAVHALDAIRYILHRADELAGDDVYCVVLNLSYGYMAGPHDGSSMIEAAIDELIALHRDLSVVVPAGNSNVLRCHAEIELKAGEAKAMTWRVLPDCATPSFLEIWLPPGADASMVNVQVSPPVGESGPVMSHNSVYVWQPGGNVLCTAVYLDRVATGTQPMILLALAPTLTRLSSRNAAPAGNWSVTVSNNAIAVKPLTIRVWVQRNETAAGFPLRGRQSRFDDVNYKRFVMGSHVRDFDEGNVDGDDATWIRRQGTLSSLATGSYTVVVGAYRRTDGKPAPYSSTGPSLNTYRAGPDATGVSEDSPACVGVLGASTRSGAFVAMTGTSAAAPQVARVLACAKAQGLAIDMGALQARVQQDGKGVSARAWVEAKASTEDPVPKIGAHKALLGSCFATEIPPVVPIGQHSWLPRLKPVRGGSGRFPSPRWRARGIKL